MLFKIYKIPIKTFQPQQILYLPRNKNIIINFLLNMNYYL